MNATFSDPICERTLTISDGGEVIVQVSAPRKGDFQADDPRDDSYCLYEIKGIGDGRTRKVWGVDSFQAIQLVQSAIGADLYSSDEARAGKLRWEAGNVPGDLGFPVPSRLADLVPSGASAIR